MSTWIYLSLGSNMGDVRGNLTGAVNQLMQHPAIKVKAISNIYETQPWGKLDQANFNNLAVALTTTLTPEALLVLIHKIEATLQRKRDIHWGPRTIDIDIIYWGKQVINTPELTIPHPQAAKRNFVLVPIQGLAQNDEQVLPQVELALSKHQDSSWLKKLGDL